MAPVEGKEDAPSSKNNIVSATLAIPWVRSSTSTDAAAAAEVKEEVEEKFVPPPSITSHTELDDGKEVEVIFFDPNIDYEKLLQEEEEEKKNEMKKVKENQEFSSTFDSKANVPEQQQQTNVNTELQKNPPIPKLKLKKTGLITYSKVDLSQTLQGLPTVASTNSECASASGSPSVSSSTVEVKSVSPNNVSKIECEISSTTENNNNRDARNEAFLRQMISDRRLMKQNQQKLQFQKDISTFLLQNGSSKRSHERAFSDLPNEPGRIQSNKRLATSRDNQLTPPPSPPNTSLLKEKQEEKKLALSICKDILKNCGVVNGKKEKESTTELLIPEFPEIIDDSFEVFKKSLTNTCRNDIIKQIKETSFFNNPNPFKPSNISPNKPSTSSEPEASFSSQNFPPKEPQISTPLHTGRKDVLNGRSPSLLGRHPGLKLKNQNRSSSTTRPNIQIPKCIVSNKRFSDSYASSSSAFSQQQHNLGTPLQQKRREHVEKQLKLQKEHSLFPDWFNAYKPVIPGQNAAARLLATTTLRPKVIPRQRPQATQQPQQPQGEQSPKFVLIDANHLRQLQQLSNAGRAAASTLGPSTNNGNSASLQPPQLSTSTTTSTITSESMEVENSTGADDDEVIFCEEVSGESANNVCKRARAPANSLFNSNYDYATSWVNSNARRREIQLQQQRKLERQRQRQVQLQKLHQQRLQQKVQQEYQQNQQNQNQQQLSSTASNTITLANYQKPRLLEPTDYMPANQPRYTVGRHRDQTIERDSLLTQGQIIAPPATSSKSENGITRLQRTPIFVVHNVSNLAGDTEAETGSAVVSSSTSDEQQQQKQANLPMIIQQSDAPNLPRNFVSIVNSNTGSVITPSAQNLLQNNGSPLIRNYPQLSKAANPRMSQTSTVNFEKSSILPKSGYVAPRGRPMHIPGLNETEINQNDEHISSISKVTGSGSRYTEISTVVTPPKTNSGLQSEGKLVINTKKSPILLTSRPLSSQAATTSSSTNPVNNSSVTSQSQSTSVEASPNVANSPSVRTSSRILAAKTAALEQERQEQQEQQTAHAQSSSGSGEKSLKELDENEVKSEDEENFKEENSGDEEEIEGKEKHQAQSSNMTPTPSKETPKTTSSPKEAINVPKESPNMNVHRLNLPLAYTSGRPIKRHHHSPRGGFKEDARFGCGWQDCLYSSQQKINVMTHIRGVHFQVPITMKRQRQLGIYDPEPVERYIDDI